MKKLSKNMKIVLWGCVILNAIVGTINIVFGNEFGLFIGIFDYVVGCRLTLILLTYDMS